MQAMLDGLAKGRGFPVDANGEQIPAQIGPPADYQPTPYPGLPRSVDQSPLTPEKLTDAVSHLLAPAGLTEEEAAAERQRIAFGQLADQQRQQISEHAASRPPPPEGPGSGEEGEPGIPPELAEFKKEGESVEDFRGRISRLLFRFGIKEGENFVGGGEPLTPEEKMQVLPLIVANIKAGNWLKLADDIRPPKTE